MNEHPVIAAFARLSEAIVRANLSMLDLALESGFEPEVGPSWEVERESFLRHIAGESDDDWVGGDA